MDFFTAAIVGVHMVSAHFPAEDYNNVNPGVYVANISGWVAGGYYNSERRASFYAGKVLPVYGPVSLTLGAVTGYDYGPVIPLIAPSILLANFRITVIPETKFNAGVAHLSLEWKL